ncbi:MAG: helix-turn-helix domain-containing protein [Deinococcota bacterium]
MKRDWHVVTDPKAADTLTDPKKYYYLAPFMRCEHSLSEAARALGMKANALFYQVKRLEQLGLIRVVRTVKRQGRASKVYRAVAQRFVIPFTHTSAESMAAAMYAMREPSNRKITANYLKALQEHHKPFGLWLTLTGDDLIDMVYAPLESEQWPNLDHLAKPDFPAVFSKYANIPLDIDTAKDIQRELITLFEKARANTQAGKTRYLLNFSIVPLDN